MARFFCRSLGVVLLFSTMGLATCQSLFNDTSNDAANITVKNP